MTWKGFAASVIGAAIAGVAMGQMVLAGYPWGYPAMVIVGVIFLSMGNWESASGRIKDLRDMGEEVAALREHVGGLVKTLPQPGAPGTALIEQAREEATTAIAALYTEWRRVNTKGWSQDFLEEALVPAFRAAISRVNPGLLGTEGKVGAPGQERKEP